MHGYLDANRYTGLSNINQLYEMLSNEYPRKYSYSTMMRHCSKEPILYDQMEMSLGFAMIHSGLPHTQPCPPGP